MTLNFFDLLDNEELDEHEKICKFRERVVEYCAREKQVLNIFRILKGIEMELQSCLDGKVQAHTERKTVEKLIYAIRIELRIIRYRIKHPELSDDRLVWKAPVGEWTGSKADLIELVYAISLVQSVDHGRASIKTIKEGFEYVFGVELGNIYDRLDDIAGRKGRRARYLEQLIDSLNKFLDNLDS